MGSLLKLWKSNISDYEDLSRKIRVAGHKKKKKLLIANYLDFRQILESQRMLFCSPQM